MLGVESSSASPNEVGVVQCTIAGVRTNVVRSPDGVNFCPDHSGNSMRHVIHCDVCSSGAFRLGEWR